MHTVYTTPLEWLDSNRADRFEIGSRITLGKDVSIDTLHVSIDTCLCLGNSAAVRCVVQHICCVGRHITRTQRRSTHVLCRSTGCRPKCVVRHMCCVDRHLGAVRSGMNASGCVFRALTPAEVGSVRMIRAW